MLLGRLFHVLENIASEKTNGMLQAGRPHMSQAPRHQTKQGTRLTP